MNLMQYNLFAYCNNSPINNFDPHGNITISFKIGANANLLFGVAYDYGFSFDFKGNIAIQHAYAIPGRDDTISIGFGVLQFAPMNSNANSFDGFQITLGGYGKGLDVHLIQTNTYSDYCFPFIY